MNSSIQAIDRSNGEILYAGELFAAAIDAALSTPNPSAFVELVFHTGGFTTCIHVHAFFTPDCYVGVAS